MRLIPFKPIRFVPVGTKFSFVSHYRMAIAETIILFVATIGLLATMGLNVGIDFRGGTLIEVRFTQSAPDLSALRTKLGALNLGDLQIQEIGAQNEVMIRLEEQTGGEAAQQAAVTKVRAELGEGVELRRVEVVGAAVSQELVQSSVIALAVATFGIFLYLWLRFEWQFSVSAILSLLHDVAFTLCILSIFQIDFDLTIVAALLTLIGYAVNDVVVTFDRVRENLRKYKEKPLDELIDLSVNETLSRTVITAGAVLIAILALYIFGGEVIHGFAFTMLVGMAVSSYTSFFIAAPMLYVLGVKRDWSGLETVRRGRPARSRA
ncbi:MULTISPECIES: protein translocase subunit SecF [Rhodomicrobium]|uniref:protein translocase subunit SecF n=1 Tax=Rhodomicrobium TaxID=1068 RepID=UPI000B4BB83D|nr:MULTISPECIES: protein translocase subunit SecF [Rhodomicrobium]